MSHAPETTSSSAQIAVLGAGSWGTALAIQFARAGRTTVLWGRDVPQMRAMEGARRNDRYLPDAVFPESLSVQSELCTALRARDILFAVPSHALRSSLEESAPHLRDDARVAWATKGFELATGLLPHEVAAEVLGPKIPLAVISGPTFAKEVGAGLPTAMTIAANDTVFAKELAQNISAYNFRAYTSADIVGVEVGGAVKNVLAIGAGISDGLGYGANTRIALIARGLAEMMRLGVALGGHKDTFMGLAGLGDLVLTCTDNLSRNRRFGLALARGLSTQSALESIGQVVEGFLAAKAVRNVAARKNVEMPICEQIYRILHDGVSPEAATKELMSRALKPESP
jgi:glycerol-3-phosphate dehydrogenase (NAD(P)+)